MLTIGFSGTRIGATKQQLEAVRFYLVQFKPDFGVHGDCLGADAQFHEICSSLHIRTIIYPSTSDIRAYCKGDDIKEPAPPLERNHSIVNASDIMLITPRTNQEILRSGTWATQRYTHKQDKAFLLIYPEGEIICSEDPDTLPRKTRHSAAYIMMHGDEPQKEG